MSKVYLLQATDLFFTILIWILIARILLTWFPNINWYNQPFKAMKEITDPILEPFRKIIPPLGGLDFSPIVAFIVLEILKVLVINILAIIL